jgi:NAD(P)H-hydrate epimerase
MHLEDVTATPLPRLPARQAGSHKGDYGRAVLYGGSRGMSGAICLAGLATLRSGAGLVTLVVPSSIQDVVASYNPCFMTRGVGRLKIDSDHISHRSCPLPGPEAHITAVGIGPGIGRASETTDFVEHAYQHLELPTVIDADGLNAIAERKAVLGKSGGPRILTPHLGEFARLAGALPEKSQRATRAAELARTDSLGQTIVVLKGHETVVTDGQRCVINRTGNPGMATGGAGDVLTGVITALLCQGLAPFDAARLGVHVHGLAGDLAADELGQVSLIASDVIDYLPAAFQSLEQQREDASG